MCINAKFDADLDYVEKVQKSHLKKGEIPKTFAHINTSKKLHSSVTFPLITFNA